MKRTACIAAAALCAVAFYVGRSPQRAPKPISPDRPETSRTEPKVEGKEAVVTIAVSLEPSFAP